MASYKFKGIIIGFGIMSKLPPLNANYNTKQYGLTLNSQLRECGKNRDSTSGHI
jgi:hypothetical protein